MDSRQCVAGLADCIPANVGTATAKFANGAISRKCLKFVKAVCETDFLTTIAVIC